MKNDPVKFVKVCPYNEIWAFKKINILKRDLLVQYGTMSSLKLNIVCEKTASNSELYNSEGYSHWLSALYAKDFSFKLGKSNRVILIERKLRKNKKTININKIHWISNLIKNFL